MIGETVMLHSWWVTYVDNASGFRHMTFIACVLSPLLLFLLIWLWRALFRVLGEARAEADLVANIRRLDLHPPRLRDSPDGPTSI